MKYRSKPTEVEAMQWSLDNHERRRRGREAALPFGETHHMRQRAQEIVAWVNANGGEAQYEPETFGGGVTQTIPRPARIAVRTANGWAYAAPGHYVVMGEAWFHSGSGMPCDEPEHARVRDFYPCDPETFERRWEPMS